MTIFNVRYTSNGINVYNYDYDYDHMFIFYTKREIEKLVRENGTCIIKNDHVNRCFILNEKNVNDVLFENKRRSENHQLLSAAMYGVLKDYVNSILKEHWLSGLNVAPAEYLAGLYRINGVLKLKEKKRE